MTSSSHTRSRLARLTLDFSELLSSPYDGVSIHVDDADMSRFCLHLCPESGPYKGLRLHFDVQLPDTWPSRPPKVQSSASVDHPNVYGSWICCDLLKEFYELPAGYTGGYTPALTLRGLFMQFLTFFSSERVEQDYGYWVNLGDAWVTTVKNVDGNSTTVTERNWRWETTCRNSSRYHCRKCGYGDVLSHIVNADPTPEGKETFRAIRTIAPPSGFVRSLVPNGVRSNEVSVKDLPKIQAIADKRKASEVPAYMRPPTKCLLSALNDDTLYEVLSALPSEALLNFCSAFERARVVATRFHILLLRELRCFFLRRPLVDCILGIGVCLDEKTRTMSSEFDWLSEYAFETFSVRRSIRKKTFGFFLPLAFSKAHFDRAEQSIWNRLVTLDDAMQKISSRRVSRTMPTQSIRVIYQFMNNVVVSLMQSTDTIMNDNSRDAATAPNLLMASERAVISYCQLYHLLTSLAARWPQILHNATYKLRAFLANPKYRSKACVPDMGEFIVMASLVLGSPPALEDGRERITWSDLNGPLLEEVFIRNVRWTLKGHPELEILENGVSEYRLEKTFQAAKTALRLTMFQVAFLSTFVAPHLTQPERLAAAYGFPIRENPSDTPVEQAMVETIKGIYAVSSWPEFFNKVRYSSGQGWGKEKFSVVLKDCVRKSEAAKYHFRCQKMKTLEDDRRRKERIWAQAKASGGMTKQGR